MNRYEVAIAVVLVAIAGSIFLVVYTDVSHALEPQVWANNHPAQTQYYEQKCNDKFGYEWEFWPTHAVMEPDKENYTITCGKDMGLFASTSEQITVAAP